MVSQGGRAARAKGGGDAVDPKTEKRRARERESARRSRRRKKEQLEGLEKLAKDLARENDALRRDLGIEMVEDPDSEFLDGITKIEEMLAANTSGEELMQNVVALKQVFVKRFSSLQTNLQEVQSILLPIMQNEVSLWLLANMTLAEESGEAISEVDATGPLGSSSSIGKKICKQLMASLAFSPDQQRHLQVFFSARRDQIRQLSGKHLEIIQLVRRLGEVQRRAADENRKLSRETDIIVSILTPQQRARLWLAVERYQPNILQILRHECPPPDDGGALSSEGPSTAASPPSCAATAPGTPAPAPAARRPPGAAQPPAAPAAAAAAGPSRHGGSSGQGEGPMLSYMPGVLFNSGMASPVDSGVAAAAAMAATMLSEPGPPQLAPLPLLGPGFAPLAPLPMFGGGLPSPFSGGYQPPSGGTTPTGFSLQLPPSSFNPGGGGFVSPTGWNLISPASMERAAAVAGGLDGPPGG